jgi:hypothetical protein
MINPPKVDTRAASDIRREVLMHLRLNRLREEQLKGRLDAALVDIFSRFTETVIDRLNRAPEKKFLAFLDLVGVSPLPMEAASVPLTFYPVPKADWHAIVPAGTQVAAPPPATGDQRPVIFETQSELAVTATQLDSLFAKNGRDAYADLSPALLSAPSSQEQASVSIPDRACDFASQPLPHLFFLSIPCNPAWQTIDRLRLQFVVETSSPSPLVPLAVQWEAGSKKTGPDAAAVPQILSPAADTTVSLSRSGEVVFNAVPGIPASVVDGQSCCWIGCRLLTPLSCQSTPEDALHYSPPAPVITEVQAECEHGSAGLSVEQAFCEKQALDVTKPYFPFGQRPSLGNALYLGCREAFSEQGAAVTLHIELINPAGTEGAIPAANPNHIQLSWEFWNGQAWSVLNSPVKKLRLASENTGEISDAGGSTNFFDGTDSLSKNGIISFSLPGLPAELDLNGIKNYWVRAHIAAGDFGREARVIQDAQTGALTAAPSTLAPPCIQSLKVDYSVKKTSKSDVVALNEWRVFRVAPSVPFRAFLASSADGQVPALYLGFSTPVAQPSASKGGASNGAGTAEPFPRLPVSAYFLLDEQSPRLDIGDSGKLGVLWEYWNGCSWKSFTVADGTQGLRTSGHVQFLVPADFSSSREFGRQRHWLRMRLPHGKLPLLRSIFLNTAPAVQAVTIRNEILGSSNGKPNQCFRTSSPSVLPGQRLEVCEAAMPSSAEQEMLRRESGGQGFIHPATENRGPRGYWIVWREVSTFNISAARDRHYVCDHVTGEISFGDGVCGMIPPTLAGNIRISHYRTGGGATGNQPAQAINKLVSAVPYVQKVMNWIPACGGSDPEPAATILDRGPRELRHGGRAVTFEDFEDLAARASREVAKARCVPQSDLSVDPAGKLRIPGVVSVVVVPRSADSKPIPSAELLEHVKDFLNARRLATAELSVVGPEYVRVDVEVEIVVDRARAATEVEQRVDAALKTYLHPVWGGPSSSGWDFGRLPQRSDVYVLIERIPGVSHIRDLTMTAVPDRPGIEKTKHFQIYCGRHRLTMTF